MNANLKIARVRKGLRQKDLAKLLGVGYQTIWGWESGRQTPTYKNMAKVAQLLDATVDELFFHDEKAVKK